MKQKRGTKVVSLLFSLILAMGLMFALSTTVWADGTDGHNHDGVSFTFNKWESTNSLPSSGNYYLSDDVTITNTWNINQGASINLCLNGHGIRLETSDSDKPVISIPENSTLDLYDCGENMHYFTVSEGIATVNDNASGDDVKSFKGGYITGGNGGDNGGGVFNEGTFNMHGGSIIGNVASNGGAGVRVEKSGKFNLEGGSICYNKSHLAAGVRVRENSTMTMKGGVISDNYVKKDNNNSGIDYGYGGGIFIEGTVSISSGSIINNKSEYNGGGIYFKDGTLNISGDPEITRNKMGEVESNIYMNSTTVINIDGPLTNQNPIGVFRDGMGVFTNGLSGKGCKANFKVDNSGTAYVIGLDSDGEARVAISRTVNIDTTGNGTVTVKDEEGAPIDSGTKIAAGSVLTVSAAAAEGWILSDGPTATYSGDQICEIDSDGKFTVPTDYDVTVTAVFKAEAVQRVQDLINDLKKPYDAAKVKEACDAYKSLTDDQKKEISSSDLAKLQAALNDPAQAQKVTLKSVKAKKGKKAVVKWKKNAKVNGYQLTYKAKGVKAKTVTIKSAKTLTKTVKKLKAGKKYTFKIRTFTKVENLTTGKAQNVYGPWSKAKKVKAKK